MTKRCEAEDIRSQQAVTSLDYCETLRAAVCAVRTVDAENDLYASSLWLVPLEGQPTQLTTTKGMNTSPAWAPDGSRIAFLSDRGGSPQIYLLSMEGGEPAPLGAFRRGVQEVQWSPDGKKLLVTAQIGVDPDQHDDVSVDDEEGSDSDGPEVVWRLPYKADGIGYILRHRTHLFSLDADNGEVTQLTAGGFNASGAAWSPDGGRIAYSRTREGRFAHRTDVWVMNADGTGERQVTHDHATAISPSWAPDGRSLVFFGATQDGNPLARPWRVDLSSGEVAPLASEELEGAPGTVAKWDEAGGTVTFVVAERGLHKVASVSLASGEVRRLVEGHRQVSQLCVGRDVLVYCSEAADQPIEIFACEADGSDERPLTTFNSWADDKYAMKVEYRQFKVPDGNGGVESIDGWLIRPRGAKGAAPLLVDVHGGPASYVMLDASMHPYWPMLCSRGWSILALNAAGSGSYGETFANRLHSRWGELDLPQHLSAVKTLQGEGIADRRVAIAGKSYGGYLSAWAIGHTDVFRAAVISAPVTNIETHYGTSDGGYYADPYSMKAEPYLDRELSQRLSPMKHADKAHTPTLIMQGKDDERCPKCQSEELYVTLMCSGEVPIEMVLYPGEGHHFLETGKPSYRVDASRRLVRWLERWINESSPGSQDKDEARSPSRETLQEA